jgi:hypothetical protein
MRRRQFISLLGGAADEALLSDKHSDVTVNNSLAN